MKIFDKNEVNTGRQAEFDIAKAVCIIGMVIVHAFEITALSQTGLNYAFTVVLNYLFGAGTFMLCMGMGIVYGKSEPKFLIRRGAVIILIGFLLNLVRSGLRGGRYRIYDSLHTAKARYDERRHEFVLPHRYVGRPYRYLCRNSGYRSILCAVAYIRDILSFC